MGPGIKSKKNGATIATMRLCYQWDLVRQHALKARGDHFNKKLSGAIGELDGFLSELINNMTIDEGAPFKWFVGRAAASGTVEEQ